MRFLIILTVCFAIQAIAPALDVEQNDYACEVKSIFADISFSKLPLYFIENQGQLDDEVVYYVQGSNKTLYFTSQGITLALTGKDGEEIIRWVVKLDFVDANPNVKPKGSDEQKAIFSYFKGKPENWKTGIPTFSKLVYSNLWPGIDLIYSGKTNQLKYEFVVKPGADPNKICLAYQGASHVRVKDTGALQVSTPVGGFEDKKPNAYQVIGGEKKEVTMDYALRNEADEQGFLFGFDLGTFDPDKPLVLDPALLVYCGFIGGSENDQGHDIAVDLEGCAYVVGSTESDETTFPVKVGPDLTHNHLNDAFVAKVKSDGTSLVYCGYIGGDNYELANNIAVDKEGNAYIGGWTESDESSFPVRIGPDLTYNRKRDAFVARVNASGTDLDYCGYIGGENKETGTEIAVDIEGNVFVAGDTKSTESSFPVVMGPDLTYNGEEDAFVAKVNAQGTKLDYCGYIGGAKIDSGNGIAVDAAGNAYVTGDTLSDESSFPVKIGPDLTHNGHKDPFVTRVNASGTDLDYCGYIGGIENDLASNIAVDPEDHAYVIGNTLSDESSFPVKIGPDLTFDGGIFIHHDAFIAKVASQGTDLVYCGYIGGNGKDIGSDIAVDPEGHAYVTGRTESDESSFPVKIGPDLTHNSADDAYVARVNALGTELDYCGYIGGWNYDKGSGIALDKEGNAFVAGSTKSVEPSFPVKVGPDLTHNSGTGQIYDAFVAKVYYNPPLSADSTTLSELGGTINFLIDASMDYADRNYILLGGVTGTDPGLPLPGGLVTLPINWDVFTDFVVSLINTPVFTNFLGTLDTTGTATAQLNAPPVPGFAGVTMHYAYALNNPWDFVSNPVAIEIVP